MPKISYQKKTAFIVSMVTFGHPTSTLISSTGMADGTSDFRTHHRATCSRAFAFKTQAFIEATPVVFAFGQLVINPVCLPLLRIKRSPSSSLASSPMVANRSLSYWGNQCLLSTKTFNQDQSGFYLIYNFLWFIIWYLLFVYDFPIAQLELLDFDPPLPFLSFKICCTIDVTSLYLPRSNHEKMTKDVCGAKGRLCGFGGEVNLSLWSQNGKKKHKNIKKANKPKSARKR